MKRVTFGLIAILVIYVGFACQVYKVRESTTLSQGFGDEMYLCMGQNEKTALHGKVAKINIDRPSKNLKVEIFAEAPVAKKRDIVPSQTIEGFALHQAIEGHDLFAINSFEQSGGGFSEQNPIILRFDNTGTFKQASLHIGLKTDGIPCSSFVDDSMPKFYDDPK